MMIWLILGLIVVICIIFLVRMVVYTDPKKIVKLFKWLIILSLIFFILLIGLKFSSFFLWLVLPVFYFALRIIAGLAISKFIRNFFNLNFKPNSFNQNNASNISSIETKFFSMSLDQSNGKVTGVIKQGELVGTNLEELSLEKLLELREEVRGDRESLDVLEAYLDRIYEHNWREEADNYKNYENETESMSLKEAYLLLGLNETATMEEIKEAHHRLMLKNHPDQGGSNFLATKINQAKELLLKNL